MRARRGGGSSLLLLLALAALVASAAAFPCPPVGFDSVQNLDLAKYMTGAWYAQLQVSVVKRFCDGAAASRRRVSFCAPGSLKFVSTMPEPVPRGLK